MSASIVTISKPDRTIQGEITLTASKSISNRALIIRALCKDANGKQPFIENLASAKDTETLLSLLNSDAPILDAGPAGTTFRFLTAYLAFQKGTQVLTGSERMKQRPIGILVDALRTLGADIEYVEKEGFPPLKINAPTRVSVTNELSISASTSSQFISALLMVAPTLPNGLKLQLVGNIVSIPYIRMTLNIMKHYGVESTWEGNFIHITPQAYRANDFRVEGDWSAASYLYQMVAFADVAELQINGLSQHSVQGDSLVATMMQVFGVESIFNDKGVLLRKAATSASKVHSRFEQNFLECPDIAQTLAVVCAGTQMLGLFSGLETLRIKETDRIAALQTELAKIGTTFSKLPPRFYKNKINEVDLYVLEPNNEWFDANEKQTTPLFHTYHDHRMAMAFAPLAMFGKVMIEDKNVVEKSYPEYWTDLIKLGFCIEGL